MAHGKAISIYFSNRALDLLRFGDTRSGRVAQVMDRYAEILRLDGPVVREMFSEPEWSKLRQAWSSTALEKPNAIGTRITFLRAMREGDPLVKVVGELTSTDFFILVELLETEQAKEAEAKTAEQTAAVEP